MWYLRRMSLGLVGVAALTLCMLLSGCGGASTTPAGLRAVASATTATTSSTPFPTATTDPSTVELAGCPTVDLGPTPPQYGAVDGLKVSIPQRWASLDNPEELMPNNEPNAPYRVPLTTSEVQQAGAFHPNLPVNPSLAPGYALQVCNQTSAAHTLTSLSVNIASFIPSSGPVTVWHICTDGPYDSATNQTTTAAAAGSEELTSWRRPCPAITQAPQRPPCPIPRQALAARIRRLPSARMSPSCFSSR